MRERELQARRVKSDLPPVRSDDCEEGFFFSFRVPSKPRGLGHVSAGQFAPPT